MSASGRTRSRQRFPMRRRIDGGRSLAVTRGCGGGGWACALARSGSRAAALACLVLFCAIAAPAAAESQPPAPTSVVVYNIVDSQRLEVLWSYPTAALSPYTFDVFKMQWKSGNQAYDSSRELRLNPFNGGTTSSVFLYSSGQKRYKSAITGLTAGIEYTVRVVAVTTMAIPAVRRLRRPVRRNQYLIRRFPLSTTRSSVDSKTPFHGCAAHGTTSAVERLTGVSMNMAAMACLSVVLLWTTISENVIQRALP